MPSFHRNYWWMRENMKVQMKPTRLGFGQSLAPMATSAHRLLRTRHLRLHHHQRVYAGKPERKARWISMGIAEQSAPQLLPDLRKKGSFPSSHLCDVRRRSQSRSDSYLDLLRQLQCPNRRSSRWRQRRPRRRDPPGARRLFRNVRTAQHERGRPLRHRRNRKATTTCC